MAQVLKKNRKNVLARDGWDLVRVASRDIQVLADLSVADRQIVGSVKRYTMTSVERRASLLAAVDYIVREQIPGDISNAASDAAAA